MARPPRIAIPGTVVFISTRVQTGLPFTPDKLTELIVESAMARALFLHPLKIIGYVMMSNHPHLMALVQCPDTLKGFMKCFKTETSHAINRLLGRRCITNWAARFDCQAILTPENVKNKAAYLYTNPQAADLEDTIEAYPGVSSWRMFVNRTHTKKVPYIRRSSIKPVSEYKSRDHAYAALKKSSKRIHTITIDPEAWMGAFGIEDPEERKQMHSNIVDEVRANELEFRERRSAAGKKVMGAEGLRISL